MYWQPLETRSIIQSHEYPTSFGRRCILAPEGGYVFSANIASYLQTITYSYNERGWLTQNSAPLFAMQLKYNDGSTPQYNGNIANQLWGTPSSLNKNYAYNYDRLNRLTSGISGDGYNETGIVYDQMGNITSLQRTSAGATIDNLAYNYIIGGNPTYQVNTITDVSGSSSGMANGATTYSSYDGNGNSTYDGRNATGVTYNMLNLPQTVPGKSIVYTYDASGQKLRRVIGTTATDYISGIQYTNGVIDFVQTEEGRALPNGATYNYEYNLSDNLGNTRLTFDTGTGIARLQQQDDYYPFGLDISRGSVPSPQNKYLYNKKELQDGLGQYDYGARFYDPIIGRWNVVDPLIEDDQESTSPYGYVFDDPIKNTDPDGREVEGPGDDFISGVKEGFVGYFTGIAHAVMNPGETIKNTFSAEGFKTAALDGVTFGGYSGTKEYFKVANAAANGDFKTVGNAVGNKAAEVTTALATEGAVKGVNAVKGLIKDARAVKLDVAGGPKTGSEGGPGAGKAFSPKIKAEAKAEANGKCVFCGDKTDTGAPGKKGNTDHARPKSRNGNNTLKNAQHTCENCNQVLKKTMTTQEYLKQKSN
jgi:RHS repeat-associated protein